MAKDEGLALVYLRRAVAADHQTARVALAWMLLEGEDDSCQDAVLLLKAAAERGPWGTCTHPARMFYASQDLYFFFHTGSVTQNQFKIPAGEQQTFSVKCKQVYLTGSATTTTFSIYASLTHIPASRMYSLTGSGITE